MERANEAGAMAYVIKPFSPADLLPAVEIAISRYAQIAALESEVADMAERFETRKRVDRAKGLLMTQDGSHRAGVVPVDPEDLDGPSPDHARGGRRRHHPRSERCRRLTDPPYAGGTAPPVSPSRVRLRAVRWCPSPPPTPRLRATRPAPLAGACRDMFRGRPA